MHRYTLIPAALLLTLTACSEQTSESRAEAEKNFPAPDQSAMTADTPKETPEAVKQLMSDIKEKGGTLYEETKEALKEGHAKASEASREVSAMAADIANETPGYAQEMADKAMEKGGELIDKTKQAVSEMAAEESPAEAQ